MLSVSSPLASAAKRGATKCRLRTTLLPQRSSQVVKPAQAGTLTTPLPESCRAASSARIASRALWSAVSYLCVYLQWKSVHPPSQASPLVGVSNTPTPLRRKFPHVSQSVGDLASEAGSAASVLEPAPGPHQARTRPAPARTRPAPGPRQGFFSDVTQFDLTDFAGQKRDLRTMEAVAGEIGHCFVVGARHQLRASTALPGRFAETLDSPPTGQLENFSQRLSA